MENETYKRQAGLIGEEGQRVLKNSAVVVIGAGGIGNISAKYLASTGVGKIIIVDSDRIEEANLNRQILFNKALVGDFKSNALCKTLNKINPDNWYVPCEGLIGESSFEGDVEWIKQHLHPYDNCVILDCTDNMKSAYIIEKIALKLNVPLVFAKTSKYFGVVTVIKDGPYLEKNYPTKQLNQDNSVFPPIGGVIGSLQAGFAIKLILGLDVDDDVVHYDFFNNVMTKFSKKGETK